MLTILASEAVARAASATVARAANFASVVSYEMTVSTRGTIANGGQRNQTRADTQSLCGHATCSVVASMIMSVFLSLVGFLRSFAVRFYIVIFSYVPIQFWVLI